MNVSEYARIFVRRGWIALVAMLIAAASAYIFSRAQTPIYRATQKILIAPARNDFGLAQTLKQLMSSWAERLSAEVRATEVLTALNDSAAGGGADTSLDMTAGDLASRVSITSDLNTLLLNIDVDLPNGIIAARVARTYGEQFVQWRNEQNAPLRLEDRINAEMLDYPPFGLARPNTAINVAAGALLGLIIGGAAIFFLELAAANIIHKPAEISRLLGLPVLGQLPSSAD
jgi:capsular polysaccharide biosynthesis protein